MRIQRDAKNGILKLSQTQYLEDLLKEYEITAVRASPAPVDDLKEEDFKEWNEEIPIRQLVGRLWWLAMNTRPDIFCSVHKCSKWQNRPHGKIMETWDTHFRIFKQHTRFGTGFYPAEKFFAHKIKRRYLPSFL